MKQKALIISFTLFVFLTLTGFSPAEESTELAGYIEQALLSNDSLLAAKAEFRAGKERVRQAGVLPDPKISVQYYLEPVETRTGPQNGAVALSQTVPWISKLSLQSKLGNHDAAIAGLRLAAVELDVVRQVKEAFVEYGYLGLSRQTVADNIELLRYLEGVARSQYAGGKSTYFDILKIQVELAKSEEKAQAIADQAVPLRIHINSLLGTEAERARTVPTRLPQVVLEVREDEIITIALDNAPALHEAQERIAKAKTGKELAEKDFYPDFTFSLKTIFTGSAEFGDPPDSGDDPVIAGMTMNLPVFRDRRHGKVAEKNATISSAQSSRRQKVRNLATEIEQTLYTYREAQRRINLYREDLLPKVSQQLEVAINGFQSGQLTILELMDAERNLLDFQLAENRAVADRALAVARLEAQVGITLADWSN